MPATGSLGGAGDIQRPSGIGAQMAIGEFWPSISENDIQSVADEHRDAETRFSAYGDTLKRKMSTSPDLLQGQAGTARVERLTEMRNHAYDVADHLGSKAVTAESYKSTVLGLKLSLTQIGDAAQQAWETAQKTKTPFSAATFKEEAATAFSTALGDIAAAPPPLPIPGEDSRKGEDATAANHETPKDEKKAEGPTTQGRRLTSHSPTTEEGGGGPVRRAHRHRTESNRPAENRGCTAADNPLADQPPVSTPLSGVGLPTTGCLQQVQQQAVRALAWVAVWARCGRRRCRRV